MARAEKKTKKKNNKRIAARRRALRWIRRISLGIVTLLVFAILLFAFLNPPTTAYMFAEARRNGGVEQEWVSLENVAPVMARSVVAAEDANFCLHWGLDINAIQSAIEDGGGRGASTISQQVVKNVYLWHGRSWFRKSLEAVLTPAVEAVWTKRRIVEVYLNVAEFDRGIFGVQAAARHYFGVDARNLSAVQAARLAAILPDPKGRSASYPSEFVRQRAAAIMDGAETIRADGRATCFENSSGD